MTDKEYKVFLQAKLRNLKRTYAKVSVHADLIDESLDLKNEIDSIEKQLKC